jgi:HAD superfamily hydrolase (TIGR01509 family)
MDMDGLMLDTERLARIAWQRAATEWGYTLLDEVYLQIVGRTVPDAERILCATLGVGFPFREVRALTQRYLEEQIAESGVPLKPGLLELLDYLEEYAIPKAVASSTERTFVLGKLAAAGLRARFDAVVCGDDVENGKPAPDIFLEAARRLGVPAEECLVLEDSDAGIEAAHAAGMVAVMVPDLKSPSPTAASHAYRVFSSLDEVKALLLELAHSNQPQRYCGTST